MRMRSLHYQTLVQCLIPAILLAFSPAVCSGSTGSFVQSCDMLEDPDPILCFEQNDLESEILFSFTLDPDQENGCTRLIQISDTRKPELEILSIQADPISLENSRITKRELLPDQPVRMGEPEIFRSLRVVPVYFSRNFMDQRSGCGKRLVSGRIRINLSDADERNILRSPPRITPSFDALYAAIVPNYKPRIYDRTGEPERYFIVTADAFEPLLQGFIAWKEAEGFAVDVFRTSELPQWPSPANLKSVIQAEYDSPNPPVYVLFCGDENVTPIFFSYDETHPGDYSDDLYYSLLAGDDILPDIFLGRLPAETGTELQTMINKILDYELHPQMTNLDFYSTAIMAASSLEPSQVDVKEQTWQRLQTYCGYRNAYKFYSWDENTVHSVLEAMNAGASIINYRGEGWRSGWNPYHEYWFTYDDVYTLQNIDLTPFVTSIGCGVCMFETPDDCWGQAMLRVGSPHAPNGAVAVIGPTWNTHTTQNNWLDRGMYRGYVYNDMYRACQMMNYGKLYMQQQFPNPEDQPYVEVNFRTYLLFGTPDLWIRTGIPQTLRVRLAYAGNSMQRYIAVREGSGAIPDAALISYTVDGWRRVFPADEYGGIPVDPEPASCDTIQTIVSGKNLIPLQTNLEWSVSGDDGRLLITEIKPDIPTDGTTGDTVELYNPGTEDIDLRGWILSDLDGYDTPFVDAPVLLQSEHIAVIEFAGPAAEEEITTTAYGVHIISREMPDFSSQEDVVALRDPHGHVVDCLAWNDGSGSGSTNVAGDLSRLTGPTTPLEINTGGWWDGPDTITQENYETYSIDWSPFAGNGGPGSIQRSWEGSPDGAGSFTVQSDTGFGAYTHEIGRINTVQ